jgi:WD40 repeat protein/uncharacterized caspase-like protein
MKRFYHYHELFILTMLIPTFCCFHNAILAQQQSPNKSTVRGLKTDKRAQAGSPQKQKDDIDREASSDGQPRLVVQLGHSDIVVSVAYSPDGRHVLTGSWDRTVKLWEADTGREVRRFDGFSGYVRKVTFSPDGRYVVAGGEDRLPEPGSEKIRVWEAETGRLVSLFSVEQTDSFTDSRIESIAVNPESNSVLIATLRRAWLWQITPPQKIMQFPSKPPVEGDTLSDDSFTISPDGRYVIKNSRGIAHILDARTGNEEIQFQGPVAAVSPDARFVLIYGDRGLRLLEMKTGREVQQLYGGHEGRVDSVQISQDDRYVLTVGNRSLLWDLKTGKQLREFRDYSATISPDGRHVLTGLEDRTARLWSIETGAELRRFDGKAVAVFSAIMSPDSRFILTGTEDMSGRLWNIETGRPTRRFDGFPVAFSSDGRLILTGGEKVGRLLDIQTNREIQRFEGHTEPITGGAFTSDGQYALTASKDETVRLWEMKSGRQLRQFQGFTLALSRDDRYLFAAGEYAIVRQFELETGETIRVFGDGDPIEYIAPHVAVSPDGRYVLASGYVPRMWDVRTGELVRELDDRRPPGDGASQVLPSVPNKTYSAGFSPDGRYIVTGGMDGAVRLWVVESGKQAGQFQSHAHWVLSTTFSPDGRYLLTGSADGTSRLYEIPTGRILCHLLTLRDGSSVVVGQEGRFDSDNLEEIRGLHWVMPDDPMQGLPVEIFMRDYYEPRLLFKVMAGEQFTPIRGLSELNRARPQVIITKIEKQAGDPAAVSITVDLFKGKGVFKRGGNRIEIETGVYDLRLFRDGQLVAYAPSGGGEIRLDGKTGKTTITFSGIKLPRRKDAPQVEFTAYAFNADRVKSATDKKHFELPEEMAPIKGRAYLLTVGVNAYENPDFDLSFAANDARIFRSLLFSYLSTSPEYEEIIQIPLISDYVMKRKLRVVTEKTATKENLKIILDLLSGRRVDAKAITRIPNADKIRPARPEDLILISFSSHGFADREGNFYFVPYDVGRSSGLDITPRFMRRCISSEELSLWLRDIDASEMVMIVDACYSAAAIDVKGFKPGPMGSRGLGQLAYDKGMRILTSTQANDVALESRLIKQGLLAYALTHDGIEARQADSKPQDNIIMLDEWLEYGVERVPALYEEIRKGELQDFGRGKDKRGLVQVLSKERTSLTKGRAFQQPSLFDFSRKLRKVALITDVMRSKPRSGAILLPGRFDHNDQSAY